MPEVVELTAATAVDELTTGQKAVLLFYADWHDETPTMMQVLQALAAASADDMLFANVNAEAVPTVSQQYHVTSVPTFVLLHANGAVADKVQGAHLIPTLTQAVQKLAQEAAPTTAAAKNDTTPSETNTTASTKESEATATAQLNTRLEALIRSAPVMIFIKGTPQAPRCGFSRQAVTLLQDEDIPFASFDILTDNAVRAGLKTYSDWPTYPQLYVHGQLMGGLDIMKEMKQENATLQTGLGLSDEDLTAFPAAPKTQSLHDRLHALITSHRVMLFMKGLPSAPKCGFSRQMVELLNAQQVPYGTFDILTDDAVRQGLKTYSNWPTFPQLYVNGELVGGLDIVQELQEDGSLPETLGAGAEQ